LQAIVSTTIQNRLDMEIQLIPQRVKICSIKSKHLECLERKVLVLPTLKVGQVRKLVQNPISDNLKSFWKLKYGNCFSIEEDKCISVSFGDDFSEYVS
jgi:hypothetical protein